MIRRTGSEGIPVDLGIHVGVAVYETRRNDVTFGIDDFGGLFRGEFAYASDSSIRDRHIGAYSRTATSVDDSAINDQ